MVLVGHHIVNSSNIGALLRLADAFNLEKVIFTGDIPLDTRKVKKVSRNAHQFVEWELATSTHQVLDHLRQNNFVIIGLELHPDAVPLNTYSFPKKNPIALVVGNEQEGIPETILTKCDGVVYIPMLGKNFSMNVASASAIALYEISSSRD